MNNITSVYPYVILMTLFLGFASIICRKNSFFRELVSDQTGQRYEALDGLRGFLALNVFFYHTMVIYFFSFTGKWSFPPSAFYTLIGDVSVSTFFMITGFLFWTKALRTNGDVKVKVLYKSRINRLVPLYVFSVVIAFIIIGVKTDFELRVPIERLMAQIVAWLSFGLIPQIDLNGFNHSIRVNGVYWSLSLEWRFYILLPFAAIFTRGYQFVLLSFAAISVTYLVFNNILGSFMLNFIFGAGAAILMEKYDLKL